MGGLDLAFAAVLGVGDGRLCGLGEMVQVIDEANPIVGKMVGTDAFSANRV